MESMNRMEGEKVSSELGGERVHRKKVKTLNETKREVIQVAVY
jgi:hypothetical protein